MASTSYHNRTLGLESVRNTSSDNKAISATAETYKLNGTEQPDVTDFIFSETTDIKSDFCIGYVYIESLGKDVSVD